MEHNLPSNPLKILQEGRIMMIERTFFSGAFLAFLGFLFLIFPGADKENFIVPMTFFPILIVPGMILAVVAYELFLPLVRYANESKALSGFKKSVGNKGEELTKDYSKLRRWRNAYIMQNPGSYYSTRFLQGMNVRRTLIHLFTCSIAGIIVAVTGVVAFGGNLSVGLTGCGLSLLLATATFFGVKNRYYLLGEIIGNAYMTENKLDPAIDRLTSG